MVEYNVVKYCLKCKKRFIVDKKNRRNVYCSSCKDTIDTENTEDTE